MKNGIVFAVVALAIILAALFLDLPDVSDRQARARDFCGKENVAAVRMCDGYIEVVSSLLGGGSTYYAEDGSSITCPVVAPGSMSPGCRKIFDAKLASGMACTDVCAEVYDFDSCAAAGYPVMESYPRQCRAGGVTYIEEI